MKPGFSIPEAPPRPYPFRQAYRGRVWRDVGATVCRDFVLFALALAFVGVANGRLALMWGGLGVAGGLVIFGQVLLALGNRRRVALIRTAPAVTATIGQPRRIWLLSELFRSAKERTYALPYRFRTDDGLECSGRIWICGCIRERLPAGHETPVLYDPARPQRSLPMRLAVMVAPHR